MKAFIFDVDGTLAETEELHRRAFNEIFEREGLNWHWDQEIYAALLKTTGGKERMTQYAKDMGAAIEEYDIAHLHQIKTERYIELLQEGAIELRQGIRALITHGRENGLKIAVATTTNLPNVEALSQAVFKKPASEVFDHIAAGDMVKKKKPHPDIYLLALEQLKMRAEDCIAFEDSLNGVKSAKTAGLQVILSHSTYTEGEDKGEADYWVEEFSEAINLDIIKEIGVGYGCHPAPH